MHALRTSAHLSRLAHLVLAWFVLTLAVAAAAPLIHPTAMHIVCTASGGAQLMVLDHEGQPVDDASHKAHCALCLSSDGPPPAPPTLSACSPSPLAHALTPIPAAHIASLTGASMPARGPPSSFA